MDRKTFENILTARIAKINQTLNNKNKEYASSQDVLHNFKANVGGLQTKESYEQVLWGYLRKHLQSVYDTIPVIKEGFKPSIEWIDEKIGDCINYFILLEMLLRERLEK